MPMKTYASIDEYISNFPPEVQKVLTKIRQTIQRAAPEATEAIRYGIPTFQLKGNLVHFAAYQKHYGFYPGAAAISDFAAELKGYETSKGTVQFPIDQPVPFELITKITKARVKANLAK